MKKILLMAAVFSATFLTAQNLKGALSVGSVTGDYEDLLNLNLSADLIYLSDITEDLKIGASAGFSHYTVDSAFADLGAEDVQFVPLALAARYHLAQKFAVGLDLGYAVGINEGNDGGMYYAPKVVVNLSDSFALTANYKVISPKVDENSLFADVKLNSFNVGVEFNL